MYSLILFLFILLLSGCAAKGKMTVYENQVVVELDRPGKFTCEKDGVKASIDTQTKNVLEDIIQLYTIRTVEKS